MSEDVQDCPVTPDVEGSDWYIQNLILLANHGIEMGITLTLGGFLVTGTLISGKRYFELTTEHLSSALDNNDFKDTMLDFMEKNSQKYQKDPVDMPPSQTGYIHLNNARFMDSQGNSVPNGGVLWRGKLNRIVGVSIGEISRS